MKMSRRALLIFCGLVPLYVADAQSASHARRAVYLDSAGVVRWQDDRREVALFGANYVLPTASDYRAAAAEGHAQLQVGLAAVDFEGYVVAGFEFF